MKIRINKKTVIAMTSAVVFLLVLVLIINSEQEITEDVVPQDEIEETVAVQTALPLSIEFEEQAGHSLPSGVLEYGFDYDIPGIVVCNYPITRVGVTITDESGDVIINEEVSFEEAEEVFEYRLYEESRRERSGTISGLSDLTYLMPGAYELVITAKTAHSDEVHELANTEFELEKTQYVTLTEEYFSDSYDIALEFFGGDEEKFMFDYIPPVEVRNITTDPAWFREYITRLPDFMGESLYVHVDAQQNFEEAVNYIETTYLRVTTPDAKLYEEFETHEEQESVLIDTGIIKLEELVQSYDGGYVSRFTSSLKLVSHHAFGTAIDLNASIVPNTYELSNREILRDDVQNHLEYNGIKEENGIEYYDFTYTGDWSEFYSGVPGTCLNYLLYELAFYRAGFSWGYYYESVCDAMHYTLTEKELSLHDDGLRKVYEYYDE